MKNFYKGLSLAAILLTIFSCTNDESGAQLPPVKNATYYIDALSGDNSNDGLSAQSAFASVNKLRYINLFAGDVVKIKRGQTHKGMISLYNAQGSAASPVLVTSYGEGELPIIDAKGYLAGVHILSSNYVTVEDLQITANGPDGEPAETDPEIVDRDKRCGVLLETVNSGTWRGITLQNLNIYDVFYHPEGWVRPADEKEAENAVDGNKYGYGIYVMNHYEGGLAYLDGITIKNCKVRDVSHTGIKCNSANKTNAEDGAPNKIYNLKIEDCEVLNAGAPGMQYGQVVDGYVGGCVVDGSGADATLDSRNQCRGSGLWVFACEKFLVEHSEFRNSKGHADSAGAHIDYNCRDIIYQYNLSENNAGGFCEILGNNFNCSYRYNVSINDGYRNKISGGSQDGKIFWLSEYSMADTGPTNSYFYNNTIYFKNFGAEQNNGEDILPKILIQKDAQGILIMNNIFYTEQDMIVGEGASYGEVNREKPYNQVFQNNLFVKGKWPAVAKGAPFAETNTIADFVNPEAVFTNKGGVEIEDYAPTSNGVMRGKQIEKLPSDAVGLYLGLDVQTDILGNVVDPVNPPIGAISFN